MVSLSRLSELLGVSPNVLVVVGGILGALILGTLVRTFALRNAAPELAAKRRASLRTWWAIAVSFAAAILLGRIGVVLFFGLVSLLALREFMVLTQVPYRDWRLPAWAYLLLGLNYWTIAARWVDEFVVLMPLVGLLAVSVAMITRERSQGYLLTAGSLYWGMILKAQGAP